MLINKAVLSVTETACLLGCSLQEVYLLIHTEALTAYKDTSGKAWHIPEQSIQEYIALHISDRLTSGSDSAEPVLSTSSFHNNYWDTIKPIP